MTALATRYNAWSFARAWASVALAQSNDAARPALYRTTLIEQFDTGVRLVATDSFVLLKAWVPSYEWEGEAEPPVDELPDSVAICSDRDQRVLQLMKYAQKIAAEDGIDTNVTIGFELGRGAETDTLEGMSQSTVKFHLSEQYDERIESPVYEGTFPNWRPLWAGHRWSPTGVVGFGADGILRLGKLSSLWSKATIEFQLGGATGVAKIVIQAPDVNVSGLVMPIRLSAVTPEDVPPSEDVEIAEFHDALDNFLAETLRQEKVDDATQRVVDAAADAELLTVIDYVMDNSGGTVDVFVEELGLTRDNAVRAYDRLVEYGALDENNYATPKLQELYDELTADPDAPSEGNGEEPV